jgi:Tfp pilus assembly PilM family ATPase/Tfp pilus assembly protein PilN
MLLEAIKKIAPFADLGKRQLLGIDLSTNVLKIAQVIIYPNKKELALTLSRSIEGLSDEDIAKTIISCVKDLKIKKPSGVITLPSLLVITKNIEVPSIDPQEIKGIINLQAGRHTPYSREEIIVDYIPVGIYKQNYTKILLLIVNSSVVKRQFAILEKAGVEIEKVLLAQEGVAALSSKVFKCDTMTSAVGLIHIDSSFTDFAIVFQNKVIFIRAIPIGRQHFIAEPEKFNTKFAEEIKKSLEAYQAENVEKNPGSLILTGALEDTVDLEIVLNDAVHLPIKVMPYLNGIVLLPDALATIAAAKDLSFLNVILPLWAFSECKVNLIPEEIKLKKAFQERGQDLIRTGIFSLTLIVLIFLLLISKIYFKSAYLRNLDKKFKSLATDAQKLEKDFQRNSLIRNYLLGRGISLKALIELHEIAPLNLEFNDIRFEGEGKFIVRGTAESMSAVFAFVDAMGKSKYFKEVKTKGATKRQEGKKDVFDFEINSLINKAVD